MYQKDIRSDLALENRELLPKESSGVEFEEENGEFMISRVHITTKEGAKSMGKPIGNYVTVDAPDILQRNAEYEERLCQRFAEELTKILQLNNDDQKTGTILVVGLGNRLMTPDALGPKVVDQLLVTRHLYEFLPEQVDQRLRSVCAIAPGVLGMTGIETLEVIKGMVSRLKPTAVLVIDALAARNAARISTTFQISDTGISPGAGVGNKRKAIDKKSLGIPVIAVGVPMVAYARTIAIDAIDALLPKLNHQMSNPDLDEAVGDALGSCSMDLVVTPKEIDIIVSDASRVMANSINLALHSNLTLEEVIHFMH